MSTRARWLSRRWGGPARRAAARFDTLLDLGLRAHGGRRVRPDGGLPLARV